MIKIISILKRLMIYLAVVTIALPISVFMMMVSAPKAQAAEASKTKTSTKPKVTTVSKVKEPLPIPKVATSPASRVEFSAKKRLAENEIFLAWLPMKPAQKYLVQWNAQGKTTFHLQVVEVANITLENLTPGTVYEIEITPIVADGSLGQPQKMTLKTLGTAPVQEVASIQANKITPAIGGGVSTAAEQVKGKETKKEEPAAQESPKPAETTKSGWNRILVALAILIIAAGAAIGGYYGYEWYAKKAEEEPPTSGESKSSSRW